MGKVTIYDGNNISMASAHTGGDMKNDKGILTGGLYNFLRTVRSNQQQFQSDKIIVAWDAANPWRRDILPSYKISRRQEERPPQVEEWYRAYNFQRGEMKRMTMMMGVEHVTVPRMEADDIAGHLSRAMKDDEIVLVTNDNDWFQLINERVSVYRPLKKGTDQDFLNLKNFQEITGCLDPAEFIQAKAIIGDDGDDVPGCKGVGLITALKYIRGELNKGKKVEAIEAWMEDPEGFDRTFKLVNLNNEIADYQEMCQVMRAEKNQADFVAACQEYQFSSIIKDLPNWLSTFKV